MVTRLIHLTLLFATVVSAAAVFSTRTNADESSSNSARRIDRFIESKWQALGVEPAAVASDRQWVRRVYLDLAGRIPTVEEADNFVVDDRPGKRIALVDDLLTGEDYPQHFADVFDALMMGRAPEDKYEQRTKQQWRSYLETVFRDNRPWDDVVAEVLLGRPDSEAKRGASWFLYERNNQHQEIAEAIAPSIFGVRIECAQCHDHMSVDEIKQEHYWGLVAFFNRGKNQHTKNGPRVAESAIGGFSDFADIYGDSSPNELSFLGAAPVAEPRPGKDAKQEDKPELYLTSSISHEPPVPKFSRRGAFVTQVVDQHPLVARAFVNRVWAMLLGRGLVHPFDEMDSMHPPSHPELLDWLAAGFEYSGYDIRKLVRTITLSKAYQLSSVRPQDADDPATFAWYIERPLTAEQLARSMQMALQGECNNDHVLVKQLRQQFTAVLPTDFVTTIKDVLYLSNNAGLNGFIQSCSGENDLIGRLLKMDANSERIEVAFATIYGREPDESESAAIDQYLQSHGESPQAGLEQMIWAMLTSAEFCLNH